MKALILSYVQAYQNIMENKQGKIQENCYFIGTDILTLPSDHNESRYPYGDNGFNYWTYSSGYMHCNEGLFSPFLRASEGAEPKIAFYVGLRNSEGELQRFSQFSVPMLADEPKELQRFTLFSRHATYYIAMTKEIISCVRTFVVDKKIYFSHYLINTTQQPLEVFTSSYLNPFLKNALIENSTDRWFRQIRYQSEGDLGYFAIETYEEKDRGSMSTNFGLVKRCISDQSALLNCEATTSRLNYVGGITSSLHTPKAVNRGSMLKTLHQTTFTETAVCADIIHLHLVEECQIDMEFSYTFDAKLDEERKNLPVSCDDILHLFEGLSIGKKDYAMKLRATQLHESKSKLQPDVVNPFMYHLMKQVEFCSEIKGFVQLSNFSLIGIRDIFQAIEGYLFYEPQAAKAKMLEAFSFENVDGRMPRQYSLPIHEGAAPAMDLRPFIDQGVWVISTVMTYLRFTKDVSLLTENCSYYEFIDEKNHIARKSGLKESVLLHLIRIMDYLLSQQDSETFCIKALYGDWNDALDGLGKSKDPSQEYGSGVSVMATLQVYQNLGEMIEILQAVNAFEKKDEHVSKEICNFVSGASEVPLNVNESITRLCQKYEQQKEAISQGLMRYALQGNRIVHGWGDKRSYYVGSNEDPDGVPRDGITSNAFWILSRLIEQDNQPENRKEWIMQAFRRLSSKYGMKTFEPAFEKGTFGVGRIPNLPAGTAENGATYIHASMFAVMALFAIGESKLAWEEIEKLLPFTHDTVSVSPFVVPNSYGDNTEFSIDGESMQDWQTGSSNVLLKTLIRFGIGFEPTMQGILLQPPVYQPFTQMAFEVAYLGRQISLVHTLQQQASIDVTDSTQVLTNVAHRIDRKFIVNGNLIVGQYNPHLKVDTLFLSDEVIKKVALNETVTIQVIDC